MKPEFKKWKSIPLFTNEMVITEQIDGRNCCICITPEGRFYTGSRRAWIDPYNDSHGFSAWAWEHKSELLKLGPGYHYGEWWGQGIGRGYGVEGRYFSLFNVSRWGNDKIRPKCCRVVPVLYSGEFSVNSIKRVITDLKRHGSYAANGYKHPEGIVIFQPEGSYLWRMPLGY